MTTLVFEPVSAVRGSVRGGEALARGYLSDVARQMVRGCEGVAQGQLVAGVHGRVHGGERTARGLISNFVQTGVVGYEPLAYGIATNRAVIPALNVAVFTEPAARVSASGHHITYGMVEGFERAARGLLSDFARTGVVGYEPAAYGAARDPVDYVGGVLAVMSPGYLFMGGGKRAVRLVEHVSLRPLAVPKLINVLTERLALVTTPTTVLQAVNHLRDAVDVVDQIGVVWKLLLQDTVSVAGVPSPSLLAMEQVVEALTLIAGAGSSVEIRNRVAETLALNDALAVVAKEQIGDTVAFGAAFSAALSARTRLLDSLLVQAVPSGSARILAVIDESIVLGDTPTSVLEALNRLQDTIGFCLTITLGDDTYLAWVVNTETRAAWTYENYPFNSFCEFEGKYYGAAADGIYTLDGEDDAGADIKARFRLGMSNMGVAREKRFPSLYLSYAADGKLVLKAITTEIDGTRTENWYQLIPRGAGGTREGRIQIGRGLKSVFWDWEVANVNGADFEIDRLQFMPMILDRKIRGRDS